MPAAANHPILKESGILIVDDEENLLEMLQLVCQNAGFKNIFIARDGMEALELLRRHSDKIDLISLDYAMPKMDGLRLAQTVANTHDRIIGLIMVTGVGDQQTAQEFYRLGNSVGLTECFVSKPVELDEIIEIYAAALSDVFAKRDKQIEQRLMAALSNFQSCLTETNKMLAVVKDEVDQVSANITNLCKQQLDDKSNKVAQLSYVWTLTTVFLLITIGIMWASAKLGIPLLSVLALVSVTLVVLILIAALDLSKGGQLSEKSLMEVLRKAFTFIGRRFK